MSNTSIFRGAAMLMLLALLNLTAAAHADDARSLIFVDPTDKAALVKEARRLSGEGTVRELNAALEVDRAVARELSGRALRVVDLPPAHRVQIRGVDVDLRARALDPARLAAGRPTPLVLTFNGVVDAGRLEALRELGVSVIGHLPPSAVIVLADASRASAAANLDGAAVLAEVEPDWKISPRVPDGPLPAALEIVLFPGAGSDIALETATNLGDPDALAFPVANRTVVTATLDWDGIMQMAALPEVEMVDAATTGTFFNNEIRVVMQTEKAHFQANQAFYNPIYSIGVWGKGQTVTLADTGILAGHDAYASGKLLFNYAVPGTCATTGDAFDHGTGTAATLAADTLAPFSGAFGTANDLDGLAVRADLIMQDIEDGNQNFCAPNDYPLDLFFPAWQVGSMIHSNSWGHWAIQPNPQGSYSWRSQAIDWYMSRAPVREQAIIFAAGNAGRTWDGFATYTPYSLSDEAHSKNAIVVGGTLNGVARDFMYGFSSRGPTDDCLGTPCAGIQRVKPDVLAPAALQIDTASAAGVSAWTGMYEGTSYSAPGVAAAATLVRDYFIQGIYPVKASDPPLGGPPSSALIKAMLVNATVPIFSTGGYEGNAAAGVASDAYPNYDQGYGRPALDNVLEPAGYRNLKAFEDDSTSVATGDVWSRTVNFKEKWGANSSCNNLRVTLAWNDPEGALLAGPKLVNDLDLEVTFNGNIFRGNHRLTGNSFDGVNNVEDVYLPMRSQSLGIQHKPVIRVYGTSVPAGSQPFAVVATYGACFDQLPCDPPPVAGGCYRGPGDTVPGATWTPPVPGCNDQIYDQGEFDGSQSPFPFCEATGIQPVPVPIEPVEPLEPIFQP